MRAIWSSVVWIAVGTLLVGCRSVVDYQAADLPLDLRGLAVQSPQRIDLSALAQRSINQDQIYPGDVVEVTVATGLEDDEPQTWPVRVDDSGAVDVPLVGPVMVAGLGLVDAEQAVRTACIERDVYVQPHVAMLMKQRKTLQVRVVGAVETPGVYQLPAAGSDLLSALVAAGGLSEEAGTEVEIRHPTSVHPPADSPNREGIALASFVATTDRPARVVALDLAKVASREHEADLHVEDGTVVMVKHREQRSVSVIGLVRRPDNYELPADDKLRVLDALALAGGPTVSIADKVRVIRHPPSAEDPITIAVSIKEAKRTGKANLILAPGDIVTVEETPTTMVVDTIRGFIRFGFTSAIPGL